jgi:tetratricopeptide (TPR) repeat protein
MNGTVEHLPVEADCERALERPDRALELQRSPAAEQLGQAGRIELLIVAAGARRDLGQLDSAAVMLQVPELEARPPQEWLARLRYAYADALLQAGRADEARIWFDRTLEVDPDSETGVTDRLLELDGVVLDDFFDDDDDETDADNDVVEDSTVDNDVVADGVDDETDADDDVVEDSTVDNDVVADGVDDETDADNGVVDGNADEVMDADVQASDAPSDSPTS